ncbi:hypothetical protein FN3523_0086 [Francisella hispaniensis]|uniref:Uncharacterized protein n=1 Tax=Francisella hispaniensis TaxID=622488 RepID=F4BIE9_9GAMM|nr:hypothetical protein FN3523_0086 [Francisella hispaniensis]
MIQIVLKQIYVLDSLSRKNLFILSTMLYRQLLNEIIFIAKLKSVLD